MLPRGGRGRGVLNGVQLESAPPVNPHFGSGMMDATSCQPKPRDCMFGNLYAGRRAACRRSQIPLWQPHLLVRDFGSVASQRPSDREVQQYLRGPGGVVANRSLSISASPRKICPTTAHPARPQASAPEPERRDPRERGGTDRATFRRRCPVHGFFWFQVLNRHRTLAPAGRSATATGRIVATLTTTRVAGTCWDLGSAGMPALN